MKRPSRVRPPAGSELALVPRVFAVSAAVLLVGSVALASILPPDMSLRQAIAAMDPGAMTTLQHLVTGVLGHGFWDVLCTPLLVRPVWLVPVCLGVVCVGGALTAMSHAAPRTKQKRS